MRRFSRKDVFIYKIKCRIFFDFFVCTYPCTQLMLCWCMFRNEVRKPPTYLHVINTRKTFFPPSLIHPFILLHCSYECILSTSQESICLIKHVVIHLQRRRKEMCVEPSKVLVTAASECFHFGYVNIRSEAQPKNALVTPPPPIWKWFYGSNLSLARTQTQQSVALSIACLSPT
jgi:hypothetical protein